MTIREGLVKAAGIVENGWCQGDWQRGKHFCIDGALQKAFLGRVYGTSKTTPAQYRQCERAYKRVAKLATGSMNGSLPSWNDAKFRVKEDVIKVLRKAARK